MSEVASIISAVVAIGGIALVMALPQGGQSDSEAGQWKIPIGKSPERKDKVVLPDAEWRKRLTPKQYEILRGHGTEARFCSPFLDNHKTGTYICAGCGNELFRSDAKFDSGTGWPSFFQPVSKDSVWLKEDRSYGMVRMEVLCAKCDGHLGHVFEDGPRDKGGLRFCMNGEVMNFREDAPANAVPH